MAGKEYETVTDSCPQYRNAGNSYVMSSAGEHDTGTPHPVFVQSRGVTSLPARWEYLDQNSYRNSNIRPPRSTFPGTHITYPTTDNKAHKNSHQSSALQHGVQPDRHHDMARQDSNSRTPAGPIKQNSHLPPADHHHRQDFTVSTSAAPSSHLPPVDHHHHHVPRQTRTSEGPVKHSHLPPAVSPRHNLKVSSQDSIAGPSSSCPSSISGGEVKILPNKKNTSVASVANERYALDADSIRDHENEDEYLIHSNNSSVCLCVFDGHDGQNAVKFTKEYLCKNVFSTRSWLIVSQSENPDQIRTALIEFIKVTDGNFFKGISGFTREKVQLQSQIPKEMKSYEAQMTYPIQVGRLQELETRISGGCTAVIAVVTKKRLYVANVGDSRAILVYQDCDQPALQVRQLSEDHGVENDQEIQRLAAIGLDPEQLRRSGRLGTQENTRSIGDYCIKAGYKDVDVISHATGEPGSCIPYVTSVEIDHQSFEYLILMSDGVYKTLEAASCSAGTDGNQLIVSLIDRQVKNQGGYNNNVASIVLKRIRRVQYDLFQRSARQDLHSDVAIANRKRDDMTLVIYKFGQ